MTLQHDDAHQDLVARLADAAHQVEIGPAPCQAIVSEGRRRQRRRRVTTVAAVLVAACATGVAVTSLQDTADRSGKVGPASRTPAPLAPHTQELATGRADGVPWSVSVDVWEPAKNEAGAARLYAAMNDREFPDTERGGGYPYRDLLDEGWFFARARTGDKNWFPSDGPLPVKPTSRGHVESTWVRLKGEGADSWLVFGHTAPDVRGVVCTWSNGATTKVQPPVLHTIKGTDSRFFVVPVPKGGGPKSATATPECRSNS
ncbi:hypothetical protein G3I40_37525 [Streptomyces sp. SID14478]|uniref:hypothetical protein n=1 Tax=Streptomyces sp. SID14478 TaxID=2706073 RepID=UPI0013E01BC7|nr:hypothetical protein [Streptomyces sp. SID14478]NEB80871.1 hypothetical protein [Streptomyces sp. SID14478]